MPAATDRTAQDRTAQAPASKRLAGLDSAFLAVETPDAPMHLTAVVMLEPSGDAPAQTYEAITRRLVPRLRELAVFRRVLREVPLGLDHPTWLEGREFDVDAHLHRVSVPAPGSRHELEELVGHLAALPLDRTRPLWDLWVVEGLTGGCTALVVKVHHALIDGVAGVEIFGRLLDTEPDPAPGGPRETESGGGRPRGGRAPSRAALLRRAVRSLVRRPFEAAGRTAEAVGRTAKRAWTAAREGDEAILPASLPAPDSALGGAITGRRVVSFASLPLDGLEDVKECVGVKLNDVVLALCTGVLRDHLEARDALPDGPLVAAVPISVAADEHDPAAGNRVSAMTVALPVQLADPIARLVAIRRETLRAKRAHRAMGTSLLSDWAELAPPALLTGLSTLYSRLDLADHHRPVANLIVSNVPGPRRTLYCAGHRVRACFPFGPIYEGCALNVTVMSFDGRLHFGWIACPDVVPDLARMGEGLWEAAEDLRNAVRRRRDPAPVESASASRSRVTGPRATRATRRSSGDVVPLVIPQRD